jgi:ABC-type branched-subunit amino acid transport system ATPase component
MDILTQHILEFDKVKAYLTQFTVSALGRAHIDALSASTDFHTIETWLAEVSEVKEIRAVHGSLPLGGMCDIRESLAHARIEGEILALIGPNGAGKTALLNCINGFYRPQRGNIYFQGQEITRLPSHRIAELGIARSFQGLQLFNGLSVLDNIMAGRHFHFKTGILSDAIFFGRTRREEIKHRKVVEKNY